MRLLNVLLVSIILITVSCSSSKRMLLNRNYDGAIAKAVKKLNKNPDNSKQTTVLSKAWKLANESDNDRIKFLKQSNEPQVWEEIFQIYNGLKYRQEIVNTIDGKVKKAIGFVYVDYDRELIESKNKAADFLLNKGKELLARNNRFDSREAYYMFNKVKDFLPESPGIDNLINESYAKGLTHVFFKIQNNSDKIIPLTFEEDILKISLKDVNNLWIDFDTYEGNIKYDHTIILNIRKIEISPEFVASKEFVETKDVEDGYQYVLDSKGNVMKDTSGNDLKVPKQRTLKCYVTRFSLGKTATVGGSLDFFDNNTRQIIKTDPISATSSFEFVYAMVKGDKEAMSKETRELTTLRIAPFPTNEEMIIRTAEELKQFTKRIIYSHRSLLE